VLVDVLSCTVLTLNFASWTPDAALAYLSSFKY